MSWTDRGVVYPKRIEENTNDAFIRDISAFLNKNAEEGEEVEAINLFDYLGSLIVCKIVNLMMLDKRLNSCKGGQVEEFKSLTKRLLVVYLKIREDVTEFKEGGLLLKEIKVEAEGSCSQLKEIERDLLEFIKRNYENEFIIGCFMRVRDDLKEVYIHTNFVAKLRERKSQGEMLRERRSQGEMLRERRSQETVERIEAIERGEGDEGDD